MYLVVFFNLHLKFLYLFVECLSSLKIMFLLRDHLQLSTLYFADEFPEKWTTWDMTTQFFSSSLGGYNLELTTQVADTYVHIYVSTEEGGPQALQNSHFQKLRLIKRQRRKRLTIRWDPR